MREFMSDNVWVGMHPTYSIASLLHPNQHLEMHILLFPKFELPAGMVKSSL